MTAAATNNMNLQDMKVYPEHECTYRFLGLAAALLLAFSLGLTAMMVRDNVVAEQFNRLMQSVYEFSAKRGLFVEDVIVEGNYRTSYDDLITALNLSENESILGVDIDKLQQQIEQLTWVRRCVVRRSFFPNNILVHIEERQVQAVWQYEGRYYPVDTEGNVIEVEDYEPDTPVLVLTGEGAPQHLTELVKVLNTDEELASRVKAAVYVSNRRWNLIFDSVNHGITVKLPEKKFAEAYQKIALLNKRQGIFKRKLTSLDVRYRNKVIVDIDKTAEDLMLTR